MKAQHATNPSAVRARRNRHAILKRAERLAGKIERRNGMKPITWNVRLALRKDPAVTQPTPAPKEPTVAEVQDTIESAVHARWPWLEARATAQRTDK